MLDGVITADQMLALPDDGFRCELVRGELLRMSPAGWRHGRVAMRLGRMLANHGEAHRLGDTFAAETGFLLCRQPDTVRAPDVAFVSRPRIEAAELEAAPGYFPGAKDLAVEVRSPGESRAAVADRAAAWLAAGCRLVWVVDPDSSTVTCLRPGRPARVLGRNDRLSGEDVVPGFRLPLGELFTAP